METLDGKPAIKSPSGIAPYIFAALLSFYAPHHHFSFLISNSREAFKRNQGRPAPPELPHKQKAHQTMGFLLVKLSIPGGNAVVTSMEQFSEKGCFPSYQSLTQETPFPVSRHPYFPSWTRWLFLRVPAVFRQTSDRCRRSFHDSSRSFRWRGLL